MAVFCGQICAGPIGPPFSKIPFPVCVEKSIIYSQSSFIHLLLQGTKTKSPKSVARTKLQFIALQKQSTSNPRIWYYPLLIIHLWFDYFYA